MGKSVDREGLGEGTALIRELHVYGQVASLSVQQISPNPSFSRGEQDTTQHTTQHTGIGRQLMQLAESIARQ